MRKGYSGVGGAAIAVARPRSTAPAIALTVSRRLRGTVARSRRRAGSYTAAMTATDLLEAPRAHLRGAHLRLPDERARLRAAERVARGRRLRRAADGEQADVVVHQHLRGARERRQQALRQPRPPGAGEARARRACRSPSAAASRRRTSPSILEKAPWVDVVFGTHNMGALPTPARAGPAQRRGADRDPRVARGLPLHAAHEARVDLQRLGVDLGRLQQHLHVLHRARRCAARRRTAGPATSSPRSRRSSTTAPSRSRCSGRTSTPTASSSATGRRSASCCARPATIEGLERVRFTSPHPAAFTDDVIDAMAETPS